MKADGNCLFHCVHHKFPGHTLETLRKMAADKLRSEPEMMDFHNSEECSFEVTSVNLPKILLLMSMI
jgi:hypothetical protein